MDEAQPKTDFWRFWRVWQQFHIMWGKAQSGEPYNKEDWNELQRRLQKIEHPQPFSWQGKGEGPWREAEVERRQNE